MPHPEEHRKNSEVISDIILGMSDGLTVPFALAAGLSGAVATSSIIVVAGLAEIVAGSISMGLGGYLAAQNSADFYYSEKRREEREVVEVPEVEREEVRSIFRTYGLSDQNITPILDEFEKKPDKWVAFMMRNELNLDEPNPSRSLWSGLTIGLSYAVGGAIPLAPYIFISVPHTALFVSIIVTLITLTVFGYLKSRFAGVNPFTGAFRTVIIGAIAAGAAYFIARIIS